MKTYTAPAVEVVKLTAMQAIAAEGGDVNDDNNSGVMSGGRN